VLCGTLLTLLLLRRELRGRLGRWIAKLPGKVDDIAVQTLADTHVWFLWAVALYAALEMLRIAQPYRPIAQNTMKVIVFLQAGRWIQSGVRRAVDAWSPAGADAPSKNTLGAAIRFLTNLVVWSVVLLLVLQNLGVEIGALMAGLGVGGVAAALASQAVLGDLFASLSIFVDRPFDLGDFIVVGEFKGTVQHIGLRTTRLTALDGEHLVLPNADVTGSRIRNFRRMQERRVVGTFGVTYETPYERVREIPEILRTIITQHEGVRFDRAHFRGYGDSALEFEYVYFVLSADFVRHMDLQQLINLEILKRFEQANIRFAFPTRTLHLRGEPLQPAERPAAQAGD
jgi:small-conductance mechanosensitive channel